MAISSQKLPLLTDQFVQKYLGKKVDFDGAYAGQCVDLFRQFCKDVLDIPQPKGVVGAADFWTNYLTDPVLKTNFEKIQNTASFIPLKGDVMIWNKKAGDGFGHVAIVLEADINKFTSLDQNFPTLSKVTKTIHDFTNVYGVLRPKTTEVTEKVYSESEMTAMRLERDKNWNLYKATLTQLQELEVSFDELEKKIGEIENRVKEKDLDIIELNSEVASRKEEYQSLIEEISKKIGLPAASDKSDILAGIDREMENDEAKRLLEKQLEQEKAARKADAIQFQTETDRLKAALSFEKAEAERKYNQLLERVEKVEKDFEQAEEKKEHISFLEKIINLFTKGTHGKKS